MLKIPVRVILGLLTFGMFFMYQLSRFNINIAIVAITHLEQKNNSTSTSHFDGKAIVLGAFFYMSWITELMGAYLLAKFGCRYVMTITFTFNAVACFLFPWAYSLHPLCAAFVRLVQGLTLGTTWPAMAWLTSKWIPKNERSRFMSAYHGAAFGASFSNLLGGIVIENLGWQYVFYATGILSIIWVLFWYPYAYDSPALCPIITKEELEYLENNLETNTNIKKVSKPIPWRAIFTSLPFWSIFFMVFSLLWFIITLAMQMPTYFDTYHNLNIKTNGLLLSIPDISKAVVGIYFPTVIDNLIKKKYLTVQNARKLSCGIGCMVPGILLMFLAFFGHKSVNLAISLTVLSIAINGAGSSSILANIVDISPNYASTLMGIVKTASNIPGIISPLIVKYILSDDNNNWDTIFLITAVMIMSSCMFYLFFTSTDIQPWNNQDDENINLDLLEKSKTDIPLEEIKNTNGFHKREDFDNVKVLLENNKTVS